MSFSAGTVKNTDSQGSTAQSMRAVLKDAIDGHPAWEWVETWSYASEDFDVYRCLATVSGAVRDFYVYVRFDAAQTMWWMASEGWNATTKKMTRPIVLLYNYTTNITCEADGGVLPATLEWAHNQSQTPQTPTVWSGVVSPYKPAVSFSGSMQDYAISVTNSTIVIAYRSLSPIYIGLLQSRVKNDVTEDPFPLYLCGNIYDTYENSGYRHYTTRHPTRGGKITKCPGMLNYPRQYALGFANTYTIGGSPTSDAFQGDATWTEPFGLFQHNSGTTWEVNGFFRGVFKTLRFANASASTVGWLDSLMIDGKTYVYLGMSCWVDQAAVA